MLTGALAAPVAHAVDLDTLIAAGGTVTQGDLVFSVTFPVTVRGSSSLIPGVRLALDPASTATGRNAVVRSVDSLGRESR